MLNESSKYRMAQKRNVFLLDITAYISGNYIR